MKIRQHPLVASVVCLLLSQPAAAADSLWDAASGLLPDEVPRPYTLVDTADPEDPALAGGVLTLSTSEIAEIVYYIQSGSQIAVPDPWTIEFEMRVVSGSSTNAARGIAGVFVTTAPQIGIGLQISLDQIDLQSGNLTIGDSASVDTDEAFHTYRIEVFGDDSVDVYYDDVLTLSGALFPLSEGNEPRVFFGNASITSQGVSEWRGFGHNGAAELCGDGIVDPGEQCDDGNTSPGDGCDALCEIEGGGGICGDGTVDAGEQCDDGNTIAGDGCSELCQDEEGGFVCAPAPLDGCIPAAKAGVTISEKKTGSEKLKAKLKGFQAATGQGDLGNPVTGATRYDLCIYGPVGQLAGELSIDRATQSCGPKQKPCFKDKGGKGWLYKDPSADADGAKKLKLGSGPEGNGKALWQAGNKAKKNQTAMPTGIAAALAGASSATVQLVVSGAECFDATLGNVKKADGLLFKAKAP